MASLERRCAEAGVKLTQQRRTIIQALEEARDHPSAEDISQRVKEIDASISPATVYRTLNMLHELNLIARHEFGEGRGRFESNMDEHYHLIDIETGEVEEFNDPRLDEVKRRIAEHLGFELVDTRLELYGKRRR